MENLQHGSDVFFLLMGAILVFAMHGGFAFLEVGTVRHKNQVNALVKIIVDFAISTVAYFFIGYTIAYGVSFLVSAGTLTGAAGGDVFGPQGITLVKFFFLCTFAAAIPAIVSGGIAERAKFLPQCAATALLVGLAYPLIEGAVWNGNFGASGKRLQRACSAPTSTTSRDQSSSMRSAAGSRWGPCCGLVRAKAVTTRVQQASRRRPFRGSRWGSWLLCIGWFGFNVMSAQSRCRRFGAGCNELAARHGGRYSGGAERRQERPGLRT